jgi:benzoylformate decarboxylase/acetolactate synthase-1/2/3 large subunit
MIGSDLLVQAIAALGIRHVALNPGATLRGLHESLLDPSSEVRPITCLHEGVAVGMAHGYAKASGVPMAVGLHDTVGVLNAALAIFNSWVDAAPMLLLGGAGPADSVARRPWIDWIHTAHDASRPIGDMLVWAENPTSLPATLEALRRAHQRATSTPAGPAYVGLDLALQEARIGRTPPIRGPLGSWTVRADADAIGRAAEAIGRARRPLIVTDRPLRDATRQHLLRLAELAAIPMVELEGAANVPVGHALDRTSARARAIEGADLLLLVDVRDPGLLGLRRGRRRAVAIDISSAPLRNSTWIVDDSNAGDPLRLAGDPGATLQALADAIQPPRRRAPWLSAGAAATARALPDDAPLDKAAIAHATAGSVVGRPSTVVHGSLGGHARLAFGFTSPGQYVGRSGGEGLGYALPASIGAALALRGSGQLAIGFQTDGDALYLPQALWTAAHERIPVLLIVENNRSYWRDEIHQRAVARERGRDEATAAAGVQLRDPDIAFPALAGSLGVEAVGPVTTTGELRRAVETGVRAVDEGRPFLIEARTA